MTSLKELLEGEKLYKSGMTIREAGRKIGVGRERLRRFIRAREDIPSDEKLIEAANRVGDEICEALVQRIKNPSKRGQHLGDY